jgi:xylan 1,4-beta-xylosidase
LATISVDCRRQLGQLKRIWTSIGYDEINFTYTTRGKRLYRTLRDVFERPYFVRNHNGLTSSNGLSGPAWGGGNVYHEDAQGNPRYWWEVSDQIYDTIVGGGGMPLIELGFMPFDLARERPAIAQFGQGFDVGREPYENGGWKQPPKDWGRWSDLIEAFVAHQVERHGREAVERWRFEVWNEPDIRSYWHGTFEEYCMLYDHAAAGAARALPTVDFGGPAACGFGEKWLDRFLDHAVNGTNHATGERGSRLDFISFHTKGAFYNPRRSYNPFIEIPEQAPSTTVMMREVTNCLEVIAKYPMLHDRPILVDECDPAVGTVYGIHDNPNFDVCNSSYYPTFLCALTRRLLDVNVGGVGVDLFTTWSFYFEGKRWFEGNRSLVTNENIEAPIMNGFRMLARMASTRVALETDSRTDALADSFSWDDREVDGIASIDDDRVTLLLWHHADRWRATGSTRVRVNVAGLPWTTGRAAISEWRIDDDHSNAYTEWQRLGRPEDPTTSQLEQLRARMGLESTGTRVIDAADNAAVVEIEVPLHACVLIEVVPVSV